MELGALQLALPTVAGSKDEELMQSVSDLWDGTFLQRFKRKAAKESSFANGLIKQLLWGEFVSPSLESSLDTVTVLTSTVPFEQILTVTSVAYCPVMVWLGPLALTHGQRSFYLLSCLASALYQLVFLSWMADAMPLDKAFLMAGTLGIINFIAFNVTNVLILIEPPESNDEPPLEYAVYRVDRHDGRIARFVILQPKRARFC